MSYDLYLRRPEGVNNRFNPSEVSEKLKDNFGYINEYVEDGAVAGFDIGVKDENDCCEFYFQNEDEGYWASCSYGLNDARFENFKQFIKTIATKLNLLIQDPQTSEEWLSSDKFSPDGEKSKTVYVNMNQFLKNIPYTQVTKEKFFIIYLIISTGPLGEKLQLCYENSGSPASKVGIGESINLVVQREIPELTGDQEYIIRNAVPYDSAQDRFGNLLPRYVVQVEVPFFYPTKTKTERPMMWIDLPQ